MPKHALRGIMEKTAPDVELVTVALASVRVPKATWDTLAKEFFALMTARARALAITQQDCARAWEVSVATTARVVYALKEMIHLPMKSKTKEMELLCRKQKFKRSRSLQEWE